MRMTIPSRSLSCLRAVRLGILVAFFFGVATAPWSGSAGEPKPIPNDLIRKGDHISIIGNTLADRMQHDGWLETFFYARLPKHELVFRNLGFASDEVAVRDRSDGFGSPDQWLTRNKTDVVFAFFGYNESYAGKPGLGKFKADLDGFIKRTLKQNYNGQLPPRLVLFSPIAHENLNDRNLPDGGENNKRLELYTAAMAEVAKTNNVVFVDLFQPTKELYAKASRPLTFNGVHLTEDGNKAVAEAIDRALFGKEAMPQRETERMERIRQAVVDKNFFWHNRYRTVDGYSIYGGRADLRFVDGQTNRVVMQRELEVLDTMSANRDKRIWAIAQGNDLKVDDSNAPPFLEVKTNKPGSLPDGKHLFLDGDEAIKKMKVGQGLKINLFASEKEFPDLANPVQMQFDAKGRLWVAVWPSYPHWKPGEEMNDKLIILEDTNGTGKADKMTVFADKLHCPTGFEFYNGGVIVAQAPDLMFLKDTTGSGKADVRQRILSGIDSADTHHTANSFVLDPGGALYFQEGVFHHTGVETPYGPAVRNHNAGVYRYEPRTHKFDTYVSFGFANPHGHVFDRWGQDIVVDGTGANPFHGALFSGQVDFPHRHGRPPQVYNQKTRPCAGMEILSSRHFPPENQGNLLVTNVIGFQGILQYQIKDKGASFQGIEAEPIVSSTDPSFRPSDIRIGGDGAIYFVDWHNPIIGHMQHNLRDPSRDRVHGRIYRIVAEGRPLLAPKKIDGERIDALLELLKEEEDRVRYRARIELGGRDSNQVIAAVQKWLTALDPKDPGYEHHRLEGLWAHPYQNVVNEDLLRQVLRSPDFRARSAATRVLCYWRDRVNAPLDLLRVQINDEHPRVRLEAIRALSFFRDEKALSVALEMLAQPDDEYLRFTFNETLNTLERRLGSQLDRKNIAQSLVNLVNSKKVSPDRLPALIETICRHGGPKELRVMWDLTLDKERTTPALRRQILEWLADAAATRRVQPPMSGLVFIRFFVQPESDIFPEMIRLAAAWKLNDAGPMLASMAENAKLTPATRFAAIDSLAVLDNPENRATLLKLAASESSMPVRFRAVAALARNDLNVAAKAAASALRDAKELDDSGPLVEAIVVRKGGPERLAAALANAKIGPDAAKRILRTLVLAGRNDADLVGVVSKFAGLDAAVKPPTSQEVAEIGKEVSAKGDAARGENVFRRLDLGCMKCHAISKAGGNVGPDLGPIGSSSPLDYIITSILDPNLSIKEEYLAKVIATSSGTIVTGIVVERNKNVVVLKDATGKLVRIPTADIEEESKGKSLMPEGITRILTRGEVLDLIKFVSELGKPGPYALKSQGAVHHWKRLRQVPAVLASDVPNRDVLRDQLLRADPDAWDSVYALVNGRLPLEELHDPTGVKVAYLQASIVVTKAGAVEIDWECPQHATLWVDEDAMEKKSRARIELAAGRHLLTVRVPIVSGAPPQSLHLELRKPAGSQAQFEVVP
ncbi:MAG: HEAT repeat domain-containing protein [Planctomycetes bacterium]|nr:HEAT repeat domain-containing protein [Planctomycetota bacterium]